MQDTEGRWHAGAVATAADNVCAAAVFTVLGADVVTVQYGVSYFSPAHHDVRAHTTTAYSTLGSSEPHQIFHFFICPRTPPDDDAASLLRPAGMNRRRRWRWTGEWWAGRGRWWL